MARAVPASAPGGAAKPLKIVARVHAMPPEHNAGAEHMLVSMLRPLVERGHDVSVWLSRYGKAHAEYEYRGIKVVRSVTIRKPAAGFPTPTGATSTGR